MDIGSAIARHRRVEEGQEEFKAMCDASVDELASDKLVAQHQLMTYLQKQKNPIVKLRDSRYLKIKTQSSQRVLNEERIATAVDKLTAKGLTDAHEPGRTLTDTVYEVIMDNLRCESFIYNSFPHITKTLSKVDKTLAAPRPAPADIEEQVRCFEEARGGLKISRSHKRAGVVEFEREKRKFEPAIVDYLHEKNTKKLKLSFADDAPSAVSAASTVMSELPPLPTFEPASDTSTPPSPPSVVTAVSLPIEIDGVQDLEIKACRRGGKMKKPTFIQFRKAMRPRLDALGLEAKGFAYVASSEAKALLVELMLDQLADMTTWVDPQERIVINA